MKYLKCLNTVFGATFIKYNTCKSIITPALLSCIRVVVSGTTNSSSLLSSLSLSINFGVKVTRFLGFGIGFVNSLFKFWFLSLF